MRENKEGGSKFWDSQDLKKENESNAMNVFFLSKKRKAKHCCHMRFQVTFTAQM